MLPIDAIESELIDAVRREQRVVLQAPAGAGKSTQVPQMLLRHGLAGAGAIVVMQPRRLAARMLARRVAREMGQAPGETVGYQVRFERCAGPATRIRYETDGILLRRLQQDPDLRDVAVIVFDEFHERHLYAELMLGFALRLQATTRPDLRVLVMSATLDVPALAARLAPCATVRAAGRAYPVDITWRPPQARFARLPAWDAAAALFPDAQRARPEGNILVFMPGGYEIRKTIEAFRQVPATRGYEVLPLYGDLPAAAQDRAVAPGGERRIIVATNVAETSLTIDGVSLVIDSGLARKARFDPRRGINTLLVEPISRAAADQRAGRAGRVCPGTCLRLWPEREHAGRPAQEEPELHRVDLAETVLTLKRLGVADPHAFPWLEPPPAERIGQAEALLAELGALDAQGQLTGTGRRLAAFPLHPRTARMLLAAEYYGCLPAACELAALLEEAPVLVRTRAETVTRQRALLMGDHDDSDVRLWLGALRFAEAHRYDRDACEPLGIHGATCRRVAATADQLRRLARSLGLDDADAGGGDLAPLYRSLLSAYPDHVAQRLGGGRLARCAVVHRRRGTVAPDSLVGPHPLLLAADISEIGRSQGDVDVQLSCVTAIEPDWLREQFPAAFHEQREVFLDPAGRQVIAEQRCLYQDLVLAARRLSDVTAAEAAAVLAAEVNAGRQKLKNWDDAVERWIARVNLVARHCPDTGIAPVDEAARRTLVEQACLGARSQKDLREQPVLPVVQHWCGGGQRAAVEREAPERVTLQNGRNVRVHYDDPAGGPYLAARIQELYDTRQAPSICRGAVRLRVRILAPNQRPIQITDDLASFWAEGYERAKKELRGRYPKHDWR